MAGSNDWFENRCLTGSLALITYNRCWHWNTCTHLRWRTFFFRLVVWLLFNRFGESNRELHKFYRKMRFQQSYVWHFHINLDRLRKTIPIYSDDWTYFRLFVNRNKLAVVYFWSITYAAITRADFLGRYRAIFIANRWEPIKRADFLYFRPTSCASCDHALWRDLWCKVKWRKRERDGEPTVHKFNVNKTSIYKIE